MSQDHAAQISAALSALGWDQASLRGWSLIARAFSGASVFRLDYPDQQLILKLTPPDDERAGREFAFLRQLAGSIPLQTPQLLAAQPGAMLFPAYTPVNKWHISDYYHIAVELAQFHAAFWDRTASLDHFPWLQHAEIVSIPASRANWKKLRDQERLSAAFSTVDWQQIENLLGCVSALEAVIVELPPTLCHRDFHPENVLLDSKNRFVVIDWQEVGIARGPEDLSFFFQRGASDVPAAAMLQAYEAALIDAGIDVTIDAIKRVVAASELRTRLLHWPAFLQDASPDMVAAQVSRTIALADELEIR